MVKREFQYKISNIDMKEFYNEMICCHTNWPAVVVMDELEDESNILRREMKNGNQIIYLKHADDMFTVLQNELELNEADVVPALPLENHDLENEELMTWIACAVEIANLLSVKCPQIFFTSFEDAFIASGEGVIFLPAKKPYGKFNVIENFLCIAHELRHEWQHVNHPDWFEGYVHVTDEHDKGQMDAYLEHRTEVDAEAYARKLASQVFDIPLFVYGERNAMGKLIKRAQEIKINLSELQIEYFTYLFDIENWDYYDDNEESDVDKSTAMVSMMSAIDLYEELQRIKYAEDKDKEINFALKICEEKLRVWGVDPDSLKLD